MTKSRGPAPTGDHSSQPISAPLARVLRVEEIKPGEPLHFETSDAERAEIMRLLELAALDRLSLDCAFEPRGEGRLLLRGTLAAALTQTCVVSLEPVASSIEIPLEVEFWPAPRVEELTRSAADEPGLGLLDWPEPIVEGKIDLGPVIYETLSTSLDPYPRAEGVRFAWAEDGGEPAPSAPPASPFAALAALKRG